jgi:hypothetical protein
MYESIASIATHNCSGRLTVEQTATSAQPSSDTVARITDNPNIQRAVTELFVSLPFWNVKYICALVYFYKRSGSCAVEQSRDSK